MAITKRTEIGQRNVLADGQIQVRIDTVIEEGGKELGRTYHRKVLAPGADVTNESPEIKRIATAEWTPAVVAAFKAEQAAREALVKVT